VQHPTAPSGSLALRVALVNPETGERYGLEADIPPHTTATGATLVEERVRTPATATPGTYDICVQAVYPDGGPVISGRAPGSDLPATEVCGGSVKVRSSDE
jgi:hypothetical protein